MKCAYRKISTTSSNLVHSARLSVGRKTRDMSVVPGANPARGKCEKTLLLVISLLIIIFTLWCNGSTIAFEAISFCSNQERVAN